MRFVRVSVHVDLLFMLAYIRMQYARESHRNAHTCMGEVNGLSRTWPRGADLDLTVQDEI